MKCSHRAVMILDRIRKRMTATTIFTPTQAAFPAVAFLKRPVNDFSSCSIVRLSLIDNIFFNI